MHSFLVRNQLLPFLLSAAACLAVAGGGRNAAAEYRATERTEHYAVTGNTARDLREQMDRMGKRGADGKSFDANTSSRIRWDFTFAPSSDECRIGTVLVLLDIRCHLPEWTDRGSAPRAVQEAWDRYLEKLTAHEHAHGELAKRTAENLELAIQNMPGKRYCDEVGSAANELANEAIRTLQRQDAEYDERTKHGVTEGAVFVP